MKFAILSNEKGQIVLIHQEDLKSDIEWIQYNSITDEFFIVYDQGELQKLDLTFDESMKRNIKHGAEVVLQQLSESKVVFTKILSLVIQDY